MDARYSRPLSQARAEAFQKTNDIKQWYHNLRHEVSRHVIGQQNLWNMDEKVFIVSGKATRQKVVLTAGQASQASKKTVNTMESVTVVEATSASGRVIPPFII